MKTCAICGKPLTGGAVVHTECVPRWISADTPPETFRNKRNGELIPFLVCLKGTEYPFRACYDGKVWGDGFSVLPVICWMPLPEPSKEAEL